MLFAKGSTSFGGNHDVSFALRSLEIGSSLSAPELLRIAGLLDNVNRIKAYGRPPRDDEKETSLTGYFNALEPLTLLANEIHRCILSEDEIADDASPGLKHVRRSITITGDKIHSQLASMVSGSYRNYLQDAVITMRDNRYCIPVKSEYKSQVPGMVHDQSSTGSTFFIEPAAIVNLNNQLILGEKCRGLFHQQGGGKGHKVQRAFEHLIGILKQQAVNGVGSGKIAAPLLRGIGLVLSIVLNLVADDPALQILDRLSNDIFAVCHHRPPLLFNFSQQVVHNIHQVADLRLAHLLICAQLPALNAHLLAD